MKDGMLAMCLFEGCKQAKFQTRLLPGEIFLRFRLTSALAVLQ
jgi:hypothetical protein